MRAERFEVAIQRAGKAYDHRFVLGSWNDHDSGGWVVAELLRNIGIAVKEKTDKVAKYRSRYPEWWLVLVDHISYANMEDARELRNHLVRPPGWSKIVLINPLNPESFQDV